MQPRPRRSRELAIALRDLARRRPREAEQYLESHSEEWSALVEADPHDAADILEAISEDAAVELITGLDPTRAASLLEELNNEVAADLLEEITPGEAASMVAKLPSDEAADIVGYLEPEARTAILEVLDDAAVDEIIDVLRYPADSAAGLMSMEPAALPVGITTGEAIEALRRLHEHVDRLQYVYVIDAERRLIGVVSFRELVFSRPGVGLDEVMIRDPVAVRAETDREHVAELIRRYGLVAMPVVDHRGQLLGAVTVDDVIDAVQREATEDIAIMVGAGAEETIYTPLPKAVRSRLPWSVVNLGTAFLVAFTVSRFEPIIDQFTVLAAYMPVVASVGGNSGAQSLAIIIRAMAVDTVPSQVIRRLLGRSVLIGLINGTAMGLLSGFIATGFTGEPKIGFVIGLATLVNLVIANFVGTGIPVLLHKLGQDPALASNLFMTMITDLVGFGGFLAIATGLL